MFFRANFDVNLTSFIEIASNNRPQRRRNRKRAMRTRVKREGAIRREV